MEAKRVPFTVNDCDEFLFGMVSEWIGAGKEQPPLIIGFPPDSDETKEPTVIDVSMLMTERLGARGKQLIAAFVNHLREKHTLGVIAVVSEAWMVVAEGKESIRKAGEVAPSEHPDRVEVVVVTFTYDGGAKQAVVAHPIIRAPGKLPHLQRGKLRVEGSDRLFSGNLMNPRRQVH